MEELVSIIMPAYNVGKYIEESIRSIQAQTYPNWELIVVNDGSTDTTQAVVERLASQDSRIRLATQPNGGVSRARNRGLELARGQHISFLDGDDLWEPTFLSELLDAKKRAHVGMAYCGYDHFYAGKFRRKYRYQFRSGWILADVIKGIVRIHLCAMVVDKELLVANALQFTEDCPIGEDQELILKLLSITQVTAVPRSLLLYNVRPNSAITSKWRWEKHIHALLAYQRAGNYMMLRLTGTDQLDKILPVFHRTRAAKVSKFLWRMLKYGYYKDTLHLMTQPEFKHLLEGIETSELGILDRLKYRIVISRNPLLWKLAGILR